jgi:ABC-2 type transport system permease protein
MNTYSWLIRREFWENRAIWIIPTVIGIALTLAALFGRVDVASLPPPSQTREYGGMVLFLFGVVFFAVMSVYSTWYLLDCLHADRKDRSILFWKSLPVSDTATVLAKLLTGLLVIPFVYFLAADATTLLIAFIVSVRAGASVAGALWHLDVWLQLQVLWLYLIVTVAIWYLPFSGWLLVVSASAKRAVMLWSILPPLALFLLERWFFGTHYLGSVLYDRLAGYLPLAFRDNSGEGALASVVVGQDVSHGPQSVWQILDPVAFVSSAATWIGLAIGAALVAVAIQLRLRRTET